MDGSVQVIGRPLDYAAVAMDSLDAGLTSPVGGDSESSVVQNALPRNMRGFVAAGYVDGKGAAMRTAIGGGEDEFDGYFIAAGVETAINPHAVMGVSLSNTDLSGSTAVAPGSVDGQLFQGALYGAYHADSGLSVNGLLSYGQYSADTSRVVAVGPSTFTLEGSEDASVITGEFGVGYTVANSQISVTPNASMRASVINTDGYSETGGGPALTFRADQDSAVDGRIGVTVAGLSPSFRPYASATVVHAFDTSRSQIDANFVGGIGSDVVFALGGDDTDWAEIGVGVESIHDNLRITLSAETTAGRDDVETQSYRAAISLKF
jgi:outer membrane autotransporter protein